MSNTKNSQKRQFPRLRVSTNFSLPKDSTSAYVLSSHGFKLLVINKGV